MTEPFSAGIGGGGFFVYYDARHGRVHTIDGREAAPATMTETAFVDPATGLPYAFQEARVSGISAGVPGTLATWDRALRRWGTTSLRRGAATGGPASPNGASRSTPRSARRSPTTRPPSASSPRPARSTFPAARRRRSGSVFRNPDLARTYDLIAPARPGRVLPRCRSPATSSPLCVSPPVASPPVGTWPFPIRPGSLRAVGPVRLRGAGARRRPTCATGASTSTGWRRRPAAVRRSARR